MKPEDAFYTLAIVILILALATGVGVGAYWRFGTPARTVIAQYERPAGIDLLEAGNLTAQKATSVQAALVDLAVRRTLRIIREPNGVFLLQLMTITGLSPLEQRLANLVFGQGGYERRVLGRDGAKASRWKRATARLDAAARRSLEARALLRKRVKSPVSAVPITAFVITDILFFAGFAYFDANGFSLLVPLTFLFSVIVTVVTFLIVSNRPMPVTPAGAALKDHLEGIKLYIAVAEADRIRMLQSPSGAEVDSQDYVRLYERLLPFAVLFGLERQWTKVLRPYLANELDWWVSSPDDFSFELGALAFAISTDTDAGGGRDGSEPGDPSDGSSDGIGDGNFGGDGGDGGDFGGDGGGGDGGGDGGGGGD